ncbi:MAG: protein kinase [Acidobacteriota bacterium]
MAGRQIGNYRIIDYLGSGGFGSVFKAEDINTPGRVVAIKELHRKHTRSATIKQRFFQEALAMARLDHANLPRLHTFGEDQGSYYLVMEFLSGKPLSEEIQEKGAIEISRAASIMAQVLAALSYAHRNQIIHRDLKPDNIMLIEGPSLQIKVLDFGIARMVGGENLTIAGEGFGTPAYMSPERIRGETRIDHRTDIYAAGIVLYEMLAGHLPFDSKASDPAVYWAEMRDFHVSRPLPSLASRGVPAELERIINKATAKKIEDRYATADEMLADLSRVSEIKASGALDAKPATLLLSIAPSPAEVYVDGILRGTSDKATERILIENLSPGLHEVRVSKTGYTEYKISVSLEEGRRTDLQVALAARPTVVMPAAENTAAMDSSTARMESSEDVATALLQVEGLPAGATIFVDSQAVALAGEDGRATLQLGAGLHEIQATAPSGALIKRTVAVGKQDSGSSRTMTFSSFQSAPTQSKTASIAREATGKKIAAAVTVILLLALATTAYFVLRSPRTTALTDQDKSQEELAATQRQLSEVQRQLEELQKKSESGSLDEKEKIEAERKRLEAEKKKLESAQKPEEEKTAAPEKTTATDAALTSAPGSEPVAEENQPPPAADSNTCLLIAVTDPEGRPAVGVRIVCEETGSLPKIHRGLTGANGRWHECGFTPGSTVRIILHGGRRLLATEQRVIQRGPNLAFITIRDPRKIIAPDEAQTDRPAPDPRPGRRPLLRRRP